MECELWDLLQDIAWKDISSVQGMDRWVWKPTKEHHLRLGRFSGPSPLFDDLAEWLY